MKQTLTIHSLRSTNCLCLQDQCLKYFSDQILSGATEVSLASSSSIQNHSDNEPELVNYIELAKKEQQ